MPATFCFDIVVRDLHFTGLTLGGAVLVFVSFALLTVHDLTVHDLTVHDLLTKQRTVGPAGGSGELKQGLL